MRRATRKACRQVNVWMTEDDMARLACLAKVGETISGCARRLMEEVLQARRPDIPAVALPPVQRRPRKPMQPAPAAKPTPPRAPGASLPSSLLIPARWPDTPTVNVTAAFMGDPPPGRSALDQKR